MKRSIAGNSWRFSSHRMVSDYATQAYGPLHVRSSIMLRDHAHGARDLHAFELSVQKHWNEVRVVQVEVQGRHPAHVGEHLTARARVHLGSLPAENVLVELLHGPIDARDEVRPHSVVVMRAVGHDGADTIFEGSSVCLTSGYQGCTVRVIPHHRFYASRADGNFSTFATRS
jgi:starch phosphorylase